MALAYRDGSAIFAEHRLPLFAVPSLALICVYAYIGPMTVSVGIVGASGYAGGELLRIVADHPKMDLVTASAGSHAGTMIRDIHPHLSVASTEVFAATNVSGLASAELVFVALPHGDSAGLTAALPPSVKVVDLGADHRLTDPAAWDRYYGVGSMSESWTYGLPELFGQRMLIASSNRVASPGCYATAVQLSLAPLLRAGMIEPADIVVVAASGTSGAGRKAAVALSATEIMGSMSAYKVGGVHQHTAEIEQQLAIAAEDTVRMSFTPLLAPMPRGIIATSTARVRPGVGEQDLRGSLVDAYGAEAFVRVLPPGRWPTTGATLGSNSAVMQLAHDEHAGRVVIVTAIDNLGKGASGQAVQNANLMFGFEETMGLSGAGVAP